MASEQQNFKFLTDVLSPPSKAVYIYDEASVRRMADAIVREAHDVDEDECENVNERMERLFLDHQALLVLNAILSFEDDSNQGHFSFETCRNFASWIRAREGTHECGRVMTADKFLREFAARVGCEVVMTQHNPLFFKGAYKEHCTRVDFAVRLARFMHFIRSPVSFDCVHRVLGL